MPLTELQIISLKAPENIERVLSCQKAIDIPGFSAFQIIPGGVAFMAPLHILSNVIRPSVNAGHWAGLWDVRTIPPQILCSLSSSMFFNGGAVFKTLLKNLVKNVELKKLGINYNELTAEEQNQLGHFKLDPLSETFTTYLKKNILTGTLIFTLFNILSDVAIILIQMSASDSTAELMVKLLALLIITTTMTLVARTVSKLLHNHLTDPMDLAQTWCMWAGFQIPNFLEKYFPELLPYNNTAFAITGAPCSAAAMALVPPLLTAITTDVALPCISTLLCNNSVFRSQVATERTPLLPQQVHVQEGNMITAPVPSPTWQRGIKYICEDVVFAAKNRNRAPSMSGL